MFVARDAEMLGGRFALYVMPVCEGLEKNAVGSLVIASHQEIIFSLKAFICYKSPKIFNNPNS